MSVLNLALPDLPDELLLDIAKHVDSNGLLGMALTCRKLRYAAQESLVRSTFITPEKVWSLVETLNKRPDLAKCLSHLHLRGISINPSVAWVAMGSLFEKGYNPYKARYRDLVHEMFPKSADIVSANAMDHDLESRLAVGVIVLFCLATNLMTLSMGATYDSVALSEEISSYMEARLESLDLTSGHHMFHRNQEQNVPSTSLLRCDRLKRLTVPLSKFGLRGYINGGLVPALQTVLPRSIQTILIVVDGGSDVLVEPSGVDRLVLATSSFPSLQSIELRFRHNSISVAWSMCTRPFLARRCLASAKSWATHRPNVTTTFGNKRFSDITASRGPHYYSSVVNPSPVTFEAGDLVAAIERAQATSHQQMEQDPDMMEALGYTKP
jgi:hypothetical protein